MKIRRWQIVVVLAALAAPLRAAQIESTSEVFVGSAAQIAGNGGAGTRLSTFSMRMVRPVCYPGMVSSLATAALSDSGATWTNNQFNAAAGSFYVEFDSGVMADIVNTDGTGKRLVFTDNLPPSVTVGSKYRVRKHLTLASIFGASNEGGLLAGQNLAQADNILLYIPQTQQSRAFFYSSVPGYSGWYRDDYTPAADTVVYPEQGLMVQRKADTSRTLYWAGAAKKGPSVVPVFPGFNLIGVLHARAKIPLPNLNLVTGDTATGLAAGNNASSADALLLMNTDGSTASYFYSNIPGYTGWYSGDNYTAATNTVVAPGTAFFLNRKAPRGLFYWTIPAE